MLIGASSIFANPVVVYVGIWSLVLALFSLGLVNHFVDPTPLGLVTIFYGFLTSVVAYALADFFSTRKQGLSGGYDLVFARLFAKKLLFVWAGGSLIDILYSGGFPLQWVVMGWEGKNYTDFGIPTLHGMLNACYLQGTTFLFFVCCVQKRKRDLLIVIVLLSWPVMMLGRGIFLSAVVQMAAVYLLMYRVRTRELIGVFVSGVFLIVLFGVIGDMRDTPNPFDYLVEDKARNVFDLLPSGFLWVYVYSTSSLNNFLANIDNVIPIGLPLYSISNMFPSIIRMAFGMDPRNDQFEFVDSNLNTSTVYAGAVSDFGAVGAIFVVYVIQQFAAYFYFEARTKKISGVLGYSVMFQVLLFSVFYDMFFLLPTLMQLIITIIFRFASDRRAVGSIN